MVKIININTGESIAGTIVSGSTGRELFELIDEITEKTVNTLNKNYGAEEVDIPEIKDFTINKNIKQLNYFLNIRNIGLFILMLGYSISIVMSIPSIVLITMLPLFAIPTLLIGSSNLLIAIAGTIIAVIGGYKVNKIIKNAFVHSKNKFFTFNYKSTSRILSFEYIISF